MTARWQEREERRGLFVRGTLGRRQSIPLKVSARQPTIRISGIARAARDVAGVQKVFQLMREEEEDGGRSLRGFLLLGLFAGDWNIASPLMPRRVCQGSILTRIDRYR